MTARGIKKPGAVTRTLHTSGVFENLDEQQSFINLVRSSK